ncbi:CAP domain-containing protein [Gracilibacillus dipsosauri]|nr:CAP domain-containing protein [Gracilibacillus dipsosauri]
MYKLFFIISLLVGMFITGCNQSSLEPEDENINPDYVNYTDEQENQADQDQDGGRFRVPVNPGREQNIFRYDNPEPGQNQQEANEMPNADKEQQDPKVENQPKSQQSNANFKQRVIELTNQARQENGVEPLSADQQVAEVAQKKSEDMSENNYFSHTSPTFGSTFDLLEDSGVEYSEALENIAAGQQSPQQVVKGWLNSEGHRKNILDPNVTHIGIGYDKDGNYWTQVFIKK